MGNVRVRFAPSPTGSLHIGGARTALFNWLFARQNKGAFILRLEDTDIERNLEEAEKGILSSLRWLGMDWDEGPDKPGPSGFYRQSQRIELYHREAQKLLDKGLVYPCYCTPEELAQQREEARRRGVAPRYDGRCRYLNAASRRRKELAGICPTLRIKVPAEGQTVVDDLIRGKVVFENSTLDDFIIMKSNSIPTYNFACVVDDSLMGITHVIRAEEHLSNTPKQLIIYEALGYQPPVFAHVPMILAQDRSKLSKRHGATSVEEFRKEGYLPEALLNYLALLGWSPGDEREMIPLDELINIFSLHGVSKHAAIYDVKKLTWLNAQYLSMLPVERIVQEALPFFQERGFVEERVDSATYEYLIKVVGVVRSRVHTLDELVEAASYFFVDDFDYEEKGVRKFFTLPGVVEFLTHGKKVLAKTEPFDLPSVEASYRNLIADLDIPSSMLIHPTRLALSGRTVGPGLFDIIVTLGKTKCVQRLDRAISFIKTCISTENIV